MAIDVDKRHAGGLHEEGVVQVLNTFALQMVLFGFAGEAAGRGFLLVGNRELGTLVFAVTPNVERVAKP